MNLYQFIKNIERISLLNNGIVSFAEGDVYDLLNHSGQTYPKVVLTLNNITDAEDDRKTVDCTFFYIDRLTDNGDNKISIQSVGITVLDQIKTRLEQEFADWEYTADQFTPFTEKFADLCAGVFTSTTIDLSMEDLCEEEGEYKEKILQIYHPGTYDVTSYTKAEVLYEKKKEEETKEVHYELTPANSSISEIIKPDDDRNVLSQVTVSANAEKVDINETITANGEYNFSQGVFIDKAEVTVNVPLIPTQEKEISIDNNNQTLEVLPDEGYDLSKVSIGVHIPQEYPTISINQNGSTKITPTGTNALIKSAIVNVNVPIKEEETKTVTITENGSTTVTPTEGKVLSRVDITVDVPNVPTPTQEKEVTIDANGTTEVTPDEGFDLSKVTVNVNVPEKTLEDRWFNVTLPTSEGVTSITQEILPNTADGMAKVTLTADVVTETKEVSVTENGETTITPTLGKLLSSVKVTTNVPQVSTMTVPDGLHFGYSYYPNGGTFDLSQWDFSQVTDFQYMFYRSRCNFTGTFNDTSKCNNFSNAFYNSAVTTIPAGLDLTNATDVSGIFSFCTSLTSASITSSLKAVNIGGMFFQCPKLTSLLVYCNSAQTCQNIVYDDFALINAQFVELGKAFTSDMSSNNHLLAITSEAFTGLEDLIGSLGFVPSDVNDATIQFKATVFNQLTANQKSILAAKNWNVTSA